ncbi:hypothetical protein R1sor_021920 [Riccia sorocarpa]|uniref:Uncharacterized protein n=1 Tax=Riccia sorocarpa TaxID=122646 RepID=A0ABD3GP73_9MARC
MIRTKQTVIKSTGGKPPDPRLGQWFKDMWKSGEVSLIHADAISPEAPPAYSLSDASLRAPEASSSSQGFNILSLVGWLQISQNNCMDRGEESPTAVSSEAEEVHGEDLDQDADPNANPHDEDEAASEDEPGLEPTDMQHIIVHLHRTEHSGPPRRLDADDIFEGLIQFEEERRKGKRKTTTALARNTKKSRPVEAVPEEPFDPMTNQTIGRKSYKEMIPLVCCSDETYAAFEKFVKCWKEGTIPDVHGTIGRSKDPRTGQDADRGFSQLSVNRFRAINGLSDEDLKLAWTVLEEWKVWVTKPAKYQGPEDVVSLKDFCKILKATRNLEKRM